MSPSRLRVALVGLGFGAEFVPIYLNHPLVERLTLCDPDKTVLSTACDRYQVGRGVEDLRTILEDGEIDVVHLVTPIPLHASQSVAVLESGKHCACTVPMATSLEDIETIIRAGRRARRRYMMMETAVYTREFLYAQEMVRSGETGRLQLLRGAHYQDMENWPPYWQGLPPMHYATHAIAPLVFLAQSRMTEVHCYGSGVMRTELVQRYGNPYPAETAIFAFERESLSAEVTRTLFHTAKAYTESFQVYGEQASFEWQQIEGELPVVFRMRPDRSGRQTPVTAERIEPPDRQDLLPQPVRRFTRRGVYDQSRPHLSFLQGGGHGGSHPHLVNELLSSISEDRPASVDAVRAADITAAGVCAHQSAMRGAAAVEIPSFG